MNKVMRADSSSADAFARFDFPIPPLDVWITCRMRFDVAALDFWAASGSPFLVGLGTYLASIRGSFHIVGPGQAVPVPAWNIKPGSSAGTINPVASPPGPTADVWQTVEFHYLSSGSNRTRALYVDGTLVGSRVDSGSAGTVASLMLGLSTFPATDPASVIYIDDVKAGTSRGASDLFSDNFEDGTLDAWTAAIGDVSVVEEPITVTPIFHRITGITINLADDGVEGPVTIRVDNIRQLEA